jgi:hypothetical protein
MVQTFNQEMFNQRHKNKRNCNVAVLGSAFAIRNSFSEFDKNASHLFHDFFYGFRTPDKLSTLLKHIYAKLPKGYIGVHVRVEDRTPAQMKDKTQFPPCGDKNGTLYKNVLERIFVGDSNETAPASVLIGRVNSNSKNCFQKFAKGRCNVTTVNDIVDGDEEIQRLIDNIHLEKSTIYLLLDQFLIALAERIEMESFYPVSTFQINIRERHRFRNKKIAMLENH